MNHRAAKLAVVCLALTALAACGAAKYSNYYALQLPAPPAPASPAARAQLGVELPRAAHLLRQDRIVYFKSTDMNFYHYHRWAEPPNYLVQSALISRLAGAGVFDNVVAYRAQKGLDYVLRGELTAMEEVDAGSDVTVRFGLALELVEQEKNQVVWTGRATREKPVTGKTVPAVVEALNAAALESLDELTRSLQAAVEQRESAKAAAAK